jgi:hypothetical protein
VFREFFRKCEISHQTVVFIEATTQIPKSGDKHNQIYYVSVKRGWSLISMYFITWRFPMQPRKDLL